MKTMQLSEARNVFSTLPDTLGEEQEALTVTRRGKPVLAVLAYDAYEALVETLEIVTDKPTMDALTEGIRQVDAGETLEWESAKKRLR